MHKLCSCLWLVALCFGFGSVCFGGQTAVQRSELAERILAATGVRGGMVAVVGCTDGRPAAALVAKGPFLVHLLHRDADVVAALQRQLVAAGCYGRATAERYDGERLPYVDEMVNLVVVAAGQPLAEEEIRRVVVPGGAAVRLDGSGAVARVWRKPWPADIDTWSHWLHGPDNNAVSADKRVGISRSLQWYALPRWSRHHNLPAGFNGLVTAGGRIYYLVDQAPNAVYGPGQWVLVARDAFNGLELWRRPVPDWNMEAWGAKERYGGRIGRFHGAPDYQAPRRLVATEDRLFVTLGFHAPVAALDGATGKTLQVYPQTTNAAEIVYRDGLLVVSRNTYQPQPGKEIVAVDARSGETLWRNASYKGIAADTGYQRKHTNAFPTLGDERVFLVDENDIVALDLQSGRELWKQRMPLTDEIVGDVDYRYSNFCTLVYHEGMVYFAQIFPSTENVNRWEMKKIQIMALDAATGEVKWQRVGGTLAHVVPPDLMVADGRVWTFDPSLDANGHSDGRLWGLDPRTGEILTELYLPNIMHPHHHRCYRNKATERFFLMGEEGIEYVDLRSGRIDTHYWVRGACRYGIMPANGLIYVTPHNCACYLGTLMHGLFALKATPSWPRSNQTGEQLFRGPAYDTGLDGESRAGATDWPTFRHDARRSGYVPVQLSPSLTRLWEASLGGRPTAPIIVGQRVYVASADRCQVYCFDTGSGRRLWEFAADGPVDTPPTYARGRIVFGTRGGSLYALTADRGQCIWQLRTGPAHVRLVAADRLQSPWPLAGSPLVLGGSVYAVAGRSMNLDSGVYVYRVDLAHGEVLQRVRLQADRQPKGETERSLLADVLASDGRRIYMKSLGLDPDDIGQYEFPARGGRQGWTREPKHILRCPAGMTDDSGLNCCFWAYRGCQAQQLVFDDKAAFGVSGPQKVGWSGSFAHDVHWPGKGFRLQKWTFGDRKPRPAWHDKTVAVTPRAMLLDNRHVLVAGAPDVVDPKDFWGAYQNRKGGRLLVLSRDDGRQMAAYDLPAVPVYNGIAATPRHLVVALEDGTIVAFGPKSGS